MNKKWIYAPVIVIAGFVIFFFYNKYKVPPVIDFKKLVLYDLDGQKVMFNKFDGQKKVVCFSASWCSNCLIELKEIYQVKQKDLLDVEIIVISDESIEKIQTFKNRTSYPFTFLKMQQRYDEVGIHSIPTSYLINPNEKVTKETVGYLDWKDASSLAHLKKLLE